ncbi:hypothetical protein DPEC_G00145910 [Dallia pectoralis]|uniref:Uncharacterized protein n=1 Tax=Dallia pectoralis TaxID=75939 RepID=A0ACC2GNP2_DALPE|nr:hypothetical protein DPEC_G00145910 [Dallia pectoralis]
MSALCAFEHSHWNVRGFLPNTVSSSLNTSMDSAVTVNCNYKIIVIIGDLCALLDSEMASVYLEDCSQTPGLNDIKHEEEENGDLTNQDGLPEEETLSTFGEKQLKDYKEKPDSCPDCGKCFITSSEVCVHQSVHSDPTLLCSEDIQDHVILYDLWSTELTVPNYKDQ